MADFVSQVIGSRKGNGDTITFNYPLGQSADDYLSVATHKIHAQGLRTLEAERADFTLAYGLASIVVTLGPNVIIENGTRVNLELFRRPPAAEAVLATLAQVAQYSRPADVFTIQLQGGAAPFDGGGGRYGFDPLDKNSAPSAPNLLVGADGARWRILAGGGGGGGANGLSAYQVAVANGFVGNEVAWLASLKGDDGDPGTSVLVQIVASADDIPDPPVGGTFYVVPAGG